MKKYTMSVLYRGQQIEKIFWAKNNKEAASILNCSVYQIKTYAFKNNNGEYFEGIRAKFDSGMLWTLERNLLRKEMPLDEMIALIDKRKDEEWAKFKENISKK